MTFEFDIHKTLAAVGHLCARNKGPAGVLKLIKMLYVADREALIRWQRPITGDSFVSMDNGPVVSKTYNLIKGEGVARWQKVWNEYVAAREGNTLTLKRVPDVTVLSQRELDVLDEAFSKVMPMSTGALIKWLHKLPEWEDPHGSSKRIDPKTILKHSLVPESAIAKAADDIEALNFARKMLCPA